MAEFVQHLINGLSLGSTYALIALGYTMVFGVLKLINFAHGDIYMLGAFFGMNCAYWFGFDANPSLFALLCTVFIAMLGCAICGFLIEYLAYRPLRKSPRINVLITAVGVSFLLEFGGQIIFGADPKFFPEIFSAGQEWIIGDIRLAPLQVINFSISLILMLILQYIVFKTRIGRALRAVSYNHELASLMGIPTNLIISLTFVIGSALAGAAGVLIALSYPKIDPLMGIMPGIKAFSAAVLGGIGNITGAVVGALILGLLEQLVVAYGAPTFRDALAFVVLILILLIRPSGLFGVHQTEKV